jgi:hypothetical protein
MSENGLTLIMQGTPISPGLAQGLIHVHRGLLGPIDAPVDIHQNSVDDEFSDDATVRISDDLLTLATRVEKEIDSRLAEVFGAHQIMLNDSSLREELRKEIVDNLVNASTAVKTVFLRWEKRFLKATTCGISRYACVAPLRGSRCIHWTRFRMAAYSRPGVYCHRILFFSLVDLLQQCFLNMGVWVRMLRCSPEKWDCRAFRGLLISWLECPMVRWHW